MADKKEIQYIGKDEIAVSDINGGTFHTNYDLNEYVRDWDDDTELTIYKKSRVVKLDKSIKLIEVKTKK